MLAFCKFLDLIRFACYNVRFVYFSSWKDTTFVMPSNSGTSLSQTVHFLSRDFLPQRLLINLKIFLAEVLMDGIFLHLDS